MLPNFGIIVLLVSVPTFSYDLFISKKEASSYLRNKRSNKNSLLEELRPGNLKRECIEEVCSAEEAFEISDNKNVGDSLWKKLTECKEGFYTEGRTTLTKSELLTCVQSTDQCTNPQCIASNSIKCVSLIRAYKCICKDGYSGKKCEKVTDPCVTSKCDEVGTSQCVVVGLKYSCECKKGFKGSLCNEAINECMSSPCGDHGSCKEEEGGYQCICDELYLGEHCERRINDCRSSGCNNRGSCVERRTASFHCVCNEGFTLEFCEKEITDCRTHGCSGHGECISPGGSAEFECRCSESYSGEFCANARDPCLDSPCDHNCTATSTSFQCSCLPGYLLNLGDQQSCEDINECIVTSHGCEFKCINTAGSFNCICEDGYSLDTLYSRYCNDINECKVDNGGCGWKCLNHAGGFSCVCPPGFDDLLVNGGQLCKDRNECLGGHNCEHACINNPGSYECTCPTGYSLNYDKRTCRDINECIKSKPCDQKCTNTKGGFECSCNRGFVFNETSNRCSDINECATNNGRCQDICSNTAGSFICSCESGFELVGKKCFDIRECSSNPCVNGRCKDGVNSFSCSCFYGYTGTLCNEEDNACSTAPCGGNGVCSVEGDGYQCSCDVGYKGSTCSEDVDECLLSNGGCQQHCNNTHGSFTCECSLGYVTEGGGCVDVDECRDGNIGVCPHSCTNTDGSYQCGCLYGFVMENGGCIDIDECLNDPCTHNCTNTEGSFVCSCQPGYIESNKTGCVDIDECESADNACGQECHNLVGSYKCGCSSGYLLSGDGTTCRRHVGCTAGNHRSIVKKSYQFGTRSGDFSTMRLVTELRHKIVMNLQVRTFKEDGILVAMSDLLAHRYIFLVIRDGGIQAGYSKGLGHTDIVPNIPVYVSDGKWHSVRLRKSGKKISLLVDGKKRASNSFTGSSALFQEDTLLYVGGIPSNGSLLPVVGVTDPSFVGCMKGVSVKGGKVVWSDPGEMKSRNKCVSDVDRLTSKVGNAAYFNGKGFLKLDATNYGHLRGLKIRTRVRTLRADGVILFVEGIGGVYFKLFLKEGDLHAEVGGSTLVQWAQYSKEGGPLCDGLWFTVYCKVLSDEIQLFVDGHQSQSSGHGNIELNGISRIYFGGLQDGTGDSYEGSLKRTVINDKKINFIESRDYVGVDFYSYPQ